MLSLTPDTKKLRTSALCHGAQNSINLLTSAKRSLCSAFSFDKLTARNFPDCIEHRYAIMQHQAFQRWKCHQPHDNTNCQERQRHFEKMLIFDPIFEQKINKLKTRKWLNHVVFERSKMLHFSGFCKGEKRRQKCMLEHLKRVRWLQWNSTKDILWNDEKSKASFWYFRGSELIL